MRNLEHPLPQTLYEHSVELLTLRYIEVMDRLSDPKRSYTAFVHTELVDTPMIGVKESGEPVMVTVRDRQPDPDSLPDLGDTLQDLESRQWDLDPDGDMEKSGRSLAIVSALTAELQERDPPPLPVDRLNYLTTLSIIAGYSKPRQERLQTVLKNRRGAPGETVDDAVFRAAVTVLQGCLLKPGEEAAIAKKVKKYTEIFTAYDGKQKEPSLEQGKAEAILSRYYLGRYVGSILDRLFDKQTARRDVLDEITVRSYDLEDPPIVMREDDEPAPVISVPWPLLPPGGGEPRGPAAEDPDKNPRAAERKERKLYPHLTDWVGAVAVGWDYGGRTVEVDLPTGDPNRQYLGALLNDANGKPFLLLADTALEDNALYYAVEGEVHDADGKPVPLLEVFKGNKPKARALGAKKVEHRGQDFHSVVMDIIITKALERME